VDRAFLACQKDAAMVGPAVTDHVRRPLAHRPGEHAVDVPGQRADFVVDLEVDAGRPQHLGGTAELLV
jgi:hypothetical protein